MIKGLKLWALAFRPIVRFPGPWILVLVFQTALELGMSALPLVGVVIGMALKYNLGAGFVSAYSHARAGEAYSGSVAFDGFRRGRLGSFLGLGVLSLLVFAGTGLLAVGVWLSHYGLDRLQGDGVNQVLPDFIAAAKAFDPVLLGLASVFWVVDLLQERLFGVATAYIVRDSNSLFTAVARSVRTLVATPGVLVGVLAPRIFAVLLVIPLLYWGKDFVSGGEDGMTPALLAVVIALSFVGGAFESWGWAVDAEYSIREMMIDRPQSSKR